MKKLYLLFIQILLEFLYFFTKKVELTELTLSDNLHSEDFSFYREAFNLYRTTRICNNIDKTINNSEQLKSKKQANQFKAHENDYTNYPDFSKNTLH